MSDAILSVKGLRQTERFLARLERRLGNLLPLMDRIGELLVSNTKHRFETETAADGTKFKPSHRAEADGGKTLTVDGHLRDSITYLPTPTSVEVGSNLIYARPNFLGATIVPKNASSLTFRLPDGELVHAMKVVIPARNPLGFDPTDAAGVRRLAERFVAGAAE